MSQGADKDADAPPILADKAYGAESVFRPESLLREARRQKGVDAASVPSVCVLDPDGDMVRTLRRDGRVERDAAWACYHTDLYTFRHGGTEFGLVGCAVGASFAVLIAEELFACGCRLLVSITSAGQLTTTREPPYFVLIDRALRDEGTSYHYLPASPFSHADSALVANIEAGTAALETQVIRGAVWTTDAPFRETREAIESAKAQGCLAVEMEAAALYAFAQARGKPVVCFAHVTNRMGQIEGDFEKGLADGTAASLEVVTAAAQAASLTKL
ncbi:MAG: nucleoside phosphorylase [Methyloligellaceae bacterium]